MATVVFRVAGQLRVAAVVKASFAMVQDRTMVLTEPDPLVTTDLHRDNNPGASLVAATDLVPYRARADVLLIGHARAPEGRPMAAMGVRLMVALDQAMLVDKRLVVQGWTDATRRTPAPFATMPLAYELAAGGPHVRENPVGVSERSICAPNILDGWRRPSPVGFGPLAPTWPVRRGLLGPAHEAVLRRPVPDLGVDFPWAYFNAAPEDQRIDYLRGEEWIGFEGMTPALPRAQSRLPGMRGVARVYGPEPGLAMGRPVALVADTLLIDADGMRVSIVWRGSFPVASDSQLASLHIYAGVETKGRPLAFPEAYHAPGGENADDAAEDPSTATVWLPSDRRMQAPAALPFAPPGTGRAALNAAPESTRQLSSNESSDDAAEDPSTATVWLPSDRRMQAPAALPFAPPGTGRAALNAAPESTRQLSSSESSDDAAEDPSTATVWLPSDRRMQAPAALPFAPPGTGRAALNAAPESTRQLSSSESSDDAAEDPSTATVWLPSDRRMQAPAALPFAPPGTGRAALNAAPESTRQLSSNESSDDAAEDPSTATVWLPSGRSSHQLAALPFAPPGSERAALATALESTRQLPRPPPARDASGTSVISPELMAQLRPATPFQAAQRIQPADEAARLTASTPASDAGGTAAPRRYRESQPELPAMPFALAEPSPPREPPASSSPAATPFERPTGVAEPGPATLDVDSPVQPVPGPSDVAPPPLMVALEVAPPSPSTPPGESASSETLGAVFLRAMSRARSRAEGPGAG
ncbi:DUF2169 domain-containing protein [Sorangium sp. So ce388]|uniref:DUF2169 family type VI secretion system accessory protein n=1 Tax=Sorangium sp. So ce388 TaxID=3133309 RepID=UPI003F5BAEF6